MKIRWRAIMFLLLAFVLCAGLAYGQQAFHLQAYNLKVEVLSAKAFEARFGNNPDIPRTDAGIIALAQKLYPPQALKEFAPPPAEIPECGQDDVGLLFAALQNPAISEATRMEVDGIIAAAIPPLPKLRISDSGHFKIYYTDSDPNAINNVTDEEIENLATLLDSYWVTYATYFKKPQYYLEAGKGRIDVKVYYISANTLGVTSSSWNHIELNSSLCVKNLCKRRTTSAHELFHRVQYAYGYISGTANMKWMTEGTAAWSQKFTNEIYRDYMGRMNTGLGAPNLNLITQRSYDACHFWVFLHERSSYAAIKDVWATYQTNGKNAKNAVNTVTTARLGLNFDKYAQKWSKANYLKDLTNAATGGFNYLENAITKTSCGVVYGPLRKVPATAASINTTSSYSVPGSVLPYGARYYVFTLGSALKNLAVSFKGTGSFAVSFIGVKNNAYTAIVDTTLNSYNFKKTLTAGQWDKLVVVVMGTTAGGNYTLTVGDCITGTWIDSFNKTWQLKQSGTTITGTRDSTAVGCGINPVTGSYTAPKIILYLNTVPTGCCTVKWEGTVTNCNYISGTWTHTGGPSNCNSSGSFTMTKQPPGIAAEPIPEEEPDPTCGGCN